HERGAGQGHRRPQRPHLRPSLSAGAGRRRLHHRAPVPPLPAPHARPRRPLGRCPHAHQSAGRGDAQQSAPATPASALTPKTPPILAPRAVCPSSPLPILNIGGVSFVACGQCAARARSSSLTTLPVAFRGSSSTISIRRGTL